jgi:hypothetical protein
MAVGSPVDLVRTEKASPGAGVAARAIRVRIERRNGYVRVCMPHARDREACRQRLEAVAAAARLERCRKVLLDARRQAPSPTIIERFDLAKEIAHLTCSHVLKIAIVEAVGHEAAGRFTETVARNRGVSLRAFTRYDAAVEWLCSQRQ